MHGILISYSNLLGHEGLVLYRAVIQYLHGNVMFTLFKHSAVMLLWFSRGHPIGPSLHAFAMFDVKMKQPSRLGGKELFTAELSLSSIENSFLYFIFFTKDRWVNIFDVSAAAVPSVSTL